MIFADGNREVAVWLYPNDPDLPGLVRTSTPVAIAALLNEHRVLPQPVTADQIVLEMVGYRPRRRAVLRVIVRTREGRVVLYAKVLREAAFAATLRRHELLIEAGIPAPPIAAATTDFVLVLRALSGRPLASAMFDSVPPCAAEDLVDLLDAMPAEISLLPRRAPWVDSVEQYAAMVAAALPELDGRLASLTATIRSAVVVSPGGEPTHGDFHEGQLLVSAGAVSGLLDVDTAGPGRRVDDLACLLAHLQTVQRMNPKQAARVQRLVRTWTPVFDERVDPVELRLRAAGVIISLATGPYRSQEQGWRQETESILASAERLVRNAHA